jgi:hypothetical protein
MTNAGNSDQRLLFENLAHDLPPEHQAEFYRTLHEIGIGPEDRDLAKLLQLCQIASGCIDRDFRQLERARRATGSFRKSRRA